MTEYELRRLAKMIVEIQSQDEAWLMAFAKAQAKLRMETPRLVSAKEAAAMLGISADRLYRIKDEAHLTYIKGGGRSCRVKFDANVIVREYEEYLKKSTEGCRILKMKNQSGDARALYVASI